MVCNMKLVQGYVMVIIYLFTNKNFRNQGLATELIQSIIQENQEAFFLAEVLDQEKTAPELAAFENEYAGLATNNREHFWTKNHFRKMDFNYYNPTPDISEHCNGLITYNSLWINNAHQLEVNHKQVLDGLQIYFQYGYCANQIESHHFEAYQKNVEQLK